MISHGDPDSRMQLIKQFTAPCKIDVKVLTKRTCFVCMYVRMYVLCMYETISLPTFHCVMSCFESKLLFSSLSVVHSEAGFEGYETCRSCRGDPSAHHVCMHEVAQ